MEILTSLYGIAAIGSWLLAIIESLAMWLFLPFLFRIGVKVFTAQAENINIDRLEIGRVYKTNHAKFIRVSDNSCLFRHRSFFFQFNTPFPVKGEVLRNASGVHTIWRVPLGTTIFFTLWLIPWVVGGVLSLFQLDITNGLISLVAGIGFMLLMVGISVSVESKRTQVALSEISSENFSHSSLPEVVDTKDGEALSREIAKKQLQHGEHLIKSFIGEKHFSFSKKEFDETRLHFPADWYCIAATQSSVIIIGLDILHNPISVKRVPSQAVVGIEYKKRLWNKDIISVELEAKIKLVLDVNSLFRNQAQAFDSIFNKG